MEILTYLRARGQFIEQGQEREANLLKRGLVLGTVPLYDGGWTILSRINREDFQGPISNIFCVREIRTKAPVLLKLNTHKINGEGRENKHDFPLDFISDELATVHPLLLGRRYEAVIGNSMTPSTRPNYNDSVIYIANSSQNGIEIGIDPLDRKKPGIVHKLKGVDLEARLIVKSWVRGSSPTTKYTGTEAVYTTENVTAMMADPGFRGQLLPKLADDILGHAVRNLSQTENLGRYVLLC